MWRSAGVLKQLRTGRYNPEETPILARVVESSSGWTSPHVEWFGMFALRNAYRGVFVSVNALAAAEALHERKLWAPAISQSYAAAYHTLGSYLANLGRVIVQTRRYEHGLMVPDQQFVANFTKRGVWKFERAEHTHRARWRLLTPHLASSEAKPAIFTELFDYLFLGESRYRPRWEEVRDALVAGRSPPEDIPWRLEQRAPQFLDRIAAVRHESVYVAAGADPHVVEALINRDTLSTRGISRQSTIFLRFAHALLLESIAMTERLAKSTRLNKSLRSWLFLAVDYPWFDDLEYDQLGDPQLASRVRGLRERLLLQ